MIIKIEEENNIITSLSYQISSTSTSYLYLRFSPKYNIPYFSSYYENEQNIKPDNETKPDNKTKPDETKTDDEKEVDGKSNDSIIFKDIIISIASLVIIIILNYNMY